jgi:hypothetical protein
MTGEQLETGSYDRHKGEATCSVCRATFDANEDSHGVSRDGETYACRDCVGTVALLRSSKSVDFQKLEYWTAEARFDGEELQTSRYPSQQAALKRAAEMAEYCWDVESFVEVN